MIKIKCSHCDFEFAADLYIESASVFTDHDPRILEPHYEARIVGKYLCPKCGTVDVKGFSCSIMRPDIIEFVLQKEIQV